MYFVQLITAIIIDHLKNNKEEELDDTTLGYRLYPFSLTYTEAVALSKVLVEQCKLIANTDIQVCISIKANDDEFVIMALHLQINHYWRVCSLWPYEAI